MKKTWKKIAGLLFAALTFALMFSILAGAEPLYRKTQYFYLNGKSGGGSGELVIEGLPENQKIVRSSVKSSTPAIASVGKLSYSHLYEEEGRFEKLPISNAKYRGTYTIGINLHKAGTTKITFKIGKKTYTSTIKVLPYTNPLSRLTITGIKNGSSTNLAGKFSKNSSTQVKLPNTQKNAQISLNAASGWKIIRVYYMAEGKNRMLTSEKESSSAVLFAGTMSAGESFRDVRVTLRNSRTGATIECSCDIN